MQKMNIKGWFLCVNLQEPEFIMLERREFMKKEKYINKTLFSHKMHISGILLCSLRGKAGHSGGI